MQVRASEKRRSQKIHSSLRVWGEAYQGLSAGECLPGCLAREAVASCRCDPSPPLAPSLSFCNLSFHSLTPHSRVAIISSHDLLRSHAPGAEGASPLCCLQPIGPTTASVRSYAGGLAQRTYISLFTVQRPSLASTAFLPSLRKPPTPKATTCRHPSVPLRRIICLLLIIIIIIIIYAYSARSS